MIKALDINFFQSWKSALLKFCSGVNVITGTSNIGKTGIVRAFVWVVKNSPQGFHFKSEFASKKDITSSGVEFTDGGWVVRERGAGLNQYTTHTTDDPLEALRADVPSEVKNIINIEDYNIQEQHDKYFLLQETPGEVSRMFNNVVGLDIIDFLSNTARDDKRRTKRKIKEYKGKIKELRESLIEFKDIKKIEELVVRIENNLKERDEKNKELSILQDLVIDIKNISESIEVSKDWLKIEDHTKNIFNQSDALRNLTNEYKEFNRVLNEIQEIKDSIPLHNAKIELGVKAQELFDLNKERSALNNIVDEYEDINAGIDIGKGALCVLKEEIEELLQQIDHCPVCGISITTDALREHVIRNYK